MTALLVEVLVPLVVAIALAVGGVRFGAPALSHWRHGRCLERIALLELELGIDVQGAWTRDPAAAALAWHENVTTVDVWETTPRVLDDGASQRKANRRWRIELARYAAGQSDRRRKG